jgi:hypothetical protein
VIRALYAPRLFSPPTLAEGCHRRLACRPRNVRRVPSDPAKWNCWRWGLGERRGQHPTALPRLPGWLIMLPERMRARRAPSSGETGGTTIVATHGPIVAGPNAGTRITTRHVNPTPPAAFTLNSAKASTVLLCCCGARVCKGYNREKADDRQIAHCICPSVDCLRYPFSANGKTKALLVDRGRLASPLACREPAMRPASVIRTRAIMTYSLRQLFANAAIAASSVAS